PLFRTAAEACGPRVIGVVLSGGQNDGTLGLAAVKKHGGLAIAQRPEDALAPGMPLSAIRHVAVDDVASAVEIGRRLPKYVRAVMTKTSGRAPIVHRQFPARPDSAEVGTNALAPHGQGRPGTPTPFICPECGGALWERRDSQLLEFTCHVGHRYTGESL